MVALAATVLGVSSSALAGGPPKFFFAGPGTIVDGVRCVLFETDQGATLAAPGLEAFAIGTRLWMEGELDTGCASICAPSGGCVEEPAFFELFEGCGTLGPGPQGCIALFTGDAIYAPLELDSFSVDDHVKVVGKIDPSILPCWPAPVPAIAMNTIEACRTLVFEGCGSFVPGPQGCPAFSAESGELFLVDEVPPGAGGEIVRIEAELTTLACPPPIPLGPGLTNIAVLGPCVPEFFSGCGTLGFGPQGCILFLADADGIAYHLATTEEFSIGDHVFVEGPVALDPIVCFPVAVFEIDNAAITACCPPGDLDGDCVVTGDDLGILLAQWGACAACVADLNGDGVVDGDDLGALLASWPSSTG